MHVLSPIAVSLRELFSRCILPSVTEARVGVSHDLRVNALDTCCLVFEGLDTSCPNIQKLDISVRFIFGVGDDIPTFEFRQLTPLLSLRPRVLDLDFEGLHLTPSDLRTISESWPGFIL